MSKIQTAVAFIDALPPLDHDPTGDALRELAAAYRKLTAPTNPVCKNCGESLWVHKEMDYSGESTNTCENYESQ